MRPRIVDLCRDLEHVTGEFTMISDKAQEIIACVGMLTGLAAYWLAIAVLMGV